MFAQLELHRLASFCRLNSLADDLLHVGSYLLFTKSLLAARLEQATTTVGLKGTVPLRGILLRIHSLGRIILLIIRHIIKQLHCLNIDHLLVLLGKLVLTVETAVP